jgi:transcriptional regulator with XRE-family HTH domain
MRRASRSINVRSSNSAVKRITGRTGRRVGKQDPSVIKPRSSNPFETSDSSPQATPPSFDLASILIELRQARSLSRPQLARHARVARAHLWAIETGKFVPGISTLEKLSEALGVSLTRFLTTSHAEFLLEDPFVRTVQGLLPRLNLEHRQLILKTLQAAPQKVSRSARWRHNCDG